MGCKAILILTWRQAAEGLLQSPTLSQLGRMTLMQIIAPRKWTLQLGDIKGAFLQATELPDQYNIVLCTQRCPQGGLQEFQIGKM